MAQPPFRIETLNLEHDRAAFHCGEHSLDAYFRTQVTQDIRRHIANCFVAVETTTSRIAGFYTLSAASIPVADLPPATTKRLPRYPTIPAVRIGRLAVDGRFQRRGLGAGLLADALQRTLTADAAAYALLVDAQNDDVVSFYERHGFRTLESRPGTLYLPVATARKARGSTAQ